LNLPYETTSAMDVLLLMCTYSLDGQGKETKHPMYFSYLPLS